MRVLTSAPLRWSDLGLRPGVDVGPFTLRFYALAYILGILLGYWHLLRMVRAPGSPMTREQVPLTSSCRNRNGSDFRYSSWGR